jgi:hypothetical protein
MDEEQQRIGTGTWKRGDRWERKIVEGKSKTLI